MYFALIKLVKLGEKGFMMAFLGLNYHAHLNPSQLTVLAVAVSLWMEMSSRGFKNSFYASFANFIRAKYIFLGLYFLIGVENCYDIVCLKLLLWCTQSICNCNLPFRNLLKKGPVFT